MTSGKLTAIAPKTSAIAQWFGSNRMLAANVGKILGGCEWVGIPFGGSMCEIPHIHARTIVASDLHRHVINLCRVAQDRCLGAQLRGRLRLQPLHGEALELAQRRCLEREKLQGADFFTMDDSPPAPDVDWAVDYFVCAWMGRSGAAGTPGEFKGGLSVRWEAGGGDSVVRFRSAMESLKGWESILRRVTFVVMDVFDFVKKCKDRAGHGIYCDPPFPGPGDGYTHKFTVAEHQRLAKDLGQFKDTRIVCRFYDVPLIRDLYHEGDWTWHHFKGRKSTNDEAPEVLLVNGEVYE